MTNYVTWDDECAYCGADDDDDDEEPLYIYECPRCYREGCPECMPGGRGCVCPECEEKME
jgi:hypothetical protein